MKRIVTEPTEAGTPISILGMLCRRWHWPTVRLSGTYRPERHYMRGPGPKSRAKQHSTNALF